MRQSFRGLKTTVKFKAPLTRRETEENSTLNEFMAPFLIFMAPFLIATEIKDRKPKKFGQ
jgi:hypothetical protein